MFFSINLVIIPPAVSIPKLKDTMSTSNIFSKTSPSSLFRTAAWIAAPYATASSGFIDLFNYLPLKNSLNNCYTLGIHVDPPTKTISFI